MFQCKNNQSGRSMVEMLGVLAIIGVLSVAGMKGFSLAMNRLRANGIGELVAAASVYAQTHDININSISDLSEDYDEVAHECVEGIEATPNGNVTVTFQDSSKCTDIMKIVEATFGRCRWESDETQHKGTFKPTSSWNPTINQCD